MKYIDIHSHLDSEDYSSDQKEVLKRMEKSEVGTISIGTSLEDSREAVKIAENNKNIWVCIGLFPTNGKGKGFDEKEFAKLVSSPKVVAIGECGLDYFRLTENIQAEKERQRENFIAQIEFAIKYNKALMLHVRDGDKKGEAYGDVYNVLKDYKGQVKGNLHFFASTLEFARKMIDLGFTISFTGVITFARNYDEVIKNIPLDKIHAETDAPFVAPVPYRGKRNEPTYVIEVVKKIAEIRGEDVEKVRLQLLENAKRVFGI